MDAPASTPEVIEAPSADSQPETPDEFPSLRISLPDQSRLVCLSESGSPAAESFRLLGVRLRHIRRDREIKTLLVTSTIPQEGKSTVAANLACSLALKKPQRVLLLEGDIRRPSQGRILGLREVPGLCEYLRNERTLAETLYHLEEAGIWILPAGNAMGRPLELLQSGRLLTLMEQLPAWFDWIIIDSPPVLPLADTSVWMRHGDGILLVVRQGTTQKRQLQRGLEAIEPKKLIGALLNSSTNTPDKSYYY
ncbi:MAG: CpsD/CapB family tyrosine-protein kinase [Acidobacteriaceae bacterium]